MNISTRCLRTGLLVWLLIATSPIWAQRPATQPPVQATKAPVVIEEKTPDMQLRIPPLDTLIAVTLRNSPTIQMQEALMRKNEYLIRSERQQWTDGIATDITAGFGNQSLLVQQPTGEVSNYDNFNNGYRIGATLRLSIYDLFGRKNQVGMAVNEYATSQHKKDVLAQEIAAQVTSQYYTLITAQNILSIKSEARQATGINRTMAEKEFNEGNIPVAELSRIIEISSKAATEYELARQHLYENIRLTENLTGIKLFAGRN